MSDLELDNFPQGNDWRLESKFQRGIAIASFVNSFALIESNGRAIAGTRSQKIKRLTPSHFILHKGDGAQLFLQPGKFGNTYDSVEFATYPDLFFIGIRNFKAFLIDHLLNEIGTYDTLFQNGDFILACEEGKWGVINCYNQVLTDFKDEH